MNRYESTHKRLSEAQSWRDGMTIQEQDTTLHALKVMSQLTEARKDATAGEWFISDDNNSYREIYNKTEDGEFSIADAVWSGGDDVFITLAANLTREDN